MFIDETGTFVICKFILYHCFRTTTTQKMIVKLNMVSGVTQKKLKRKLIKGKKLCFRSSYRKTEAAM